jgi:hypothetical protein
MCLLHRHKEATRLELAILSFVGPPEYFGVAQMWLRCGSDAEGSEL